MAITFHTADIKFSLSNRIALKKFIAKQIASSGRQLVALSFVFCSDEYLLRINRQFLNHDFYTDIITFPLNQDDEHIEAEIYISIDRVMENSVKFEMRKPEAGIKGKSTTGPVASSSNYLPELQRVMFHGVLHLLGYKDKTKADKIEMRKMEDRWLLQFKRQ